VTAIETDKRLRSDFTWVVTGNAFYSICQWSIVVVLAKLGTPAKVGEYALGMAVAGPIVLFAGLQLRALVASESGTRLSFEQYLAFRLVSLGVALVLVAAVSFSQHEVRLRAIIFLVGLAQAVECLSDTYYGFMQKHERMDRISISLLLKGPISLAALGSAMYATGSIGWAVFGLAIGRLSIVFAWDMRTGFLGADRSIPATERRVRLQWDFGKMLGLLKMALPLGFILMFAALNSSIPRYFLEARAGSAELGIFSAVASLLSAGTLVISAFGQSIFVPVARAFAAFDRAKIRYYVLLCVFSGISLGAGGILLAALFGREILTWLFRPEYGERSSVLVPLAIAGAVGFVASGFGYVLTAARKLFPQIPVLTASAIAAAGTSAWLIPGHGLNGAVDAVLAASFVQLIGLLMILRKMDRQLGYEMAIAQFRNQDASARCAVLQGQQTV
jgi:O-antigen/teichoic acid export membrane protein